MESDFGGREEQPGRREQPGRPAPSEALQALDALSADGARLASRVVTPWWYHTILGLVMAVIVVSQALPGTTSLIVVAIGIVMMPLLAVTYARRYGIWITQPAGSRSKRVLWLIFGIGLLAMTASLAIRITGISLGWALVPAGVVLVATILIGRHYDTVLRDELAQGAGRDT